MLGKIIDHIMVTLIHLLSHCHPKFDINVGISWEQNPIPIWGGMARPWLPMADPYANIGEYVFATLSANVEELV